MDGLAVSLDDKYVATTGRIYLNGNQALVRLPISQHMRDVRRGLDTAAFISGYRGSPLSNYDQELWKAKRFIEAHNIHFQPGLNEELAATAVWGSQQTGIWSKSKYDGVFGLWYAKNPGLDRAGDAMKHGNYAGSSKHGGVLIVVGDDHAAKSATIPNQSDYTVMGLGMPMLQPADLQDLLDLGQWGWELSRYSGCWVAFKAEPNIIERSASVFVDLDRVDPRLPTDFELPPGGVNLRWPDDRFQPEARLYDFKLPAAEAFARANGIDRVIFPRTARSRIGIVTTGKAYLDVREALHELGIDERRAAEIGLTLLKVGMSWPIEKVGARAFAEGLQELLVIEEKGPVMEEQLRALLYHMPEARRPRVVGKTTESGAPLLSPKMDFNPVDLARVIAARVQGLGHDEGVAGRLMALEQRIAGMSVTPTGIVRSAFFCSGCPHNTSIKHPEGSRALAGIGCHWMALWVPELKTEPSVQMGGEGANWIGQAPFSETEHVFQNLGDGTYFHSGSMAIRAAKASGVNMTYKILYNDAVAMTGGQAVDGFPPPTVADVTRQLASEGVTPIVVVTDEPEKYGPDHGFAPGTRVHPRSELIAVEQDLARTKGVSALIYDQTCAAEKRRRRKKGTFPDPARRMFINEAVCEGCGDCSVKSNCISIEPLETEFGRKRVINQSSCNKDYSCNEGFCPSFVTVEGAQLKKRGATAVPNIDALPEPALPSVEHPYNLIVTGIGGTGVVTVGALLGMAAHIEGKGCSVLDSIGLAQKNGAVVSYVRIGGTPEEIHAPRVPVATADCLIACDILVAAGKEALKTVRPGHTKAVVNTHIAPTADFVQQPDIDFDAEGLARRITDAAGKENVQVVEAHDLAVALLGDAIGANVFMLGVAYQKGCLPVSRAAIEQAIELNGVAIGMNKLAFAWGRLAGHDPALVRRLAGFDKPAEPAVLDPVERRAAFLAAYQDGAWADRYRRFVAEVRDAEQARVPGQGRLAEAVARYHFKLMAYKDEYEVARLHTDPAFMARLKDTFEDGFTLRFNMAPPLLAGRDTVTGHKTKKSFGPWMMGLLRLLARGKRLRGTALDPFGYQAERRQERRLIGEYEATIRGLLATLDRANLDTAVQIASLPEQIRGYGHVKDKAIAEARARQAELLGVYSRPRTTPRHSAA